MYKFPNIKSIAIGLRNQTHSLAEMDTIQLDIKFNWKIVECIFTQDMYDAYGKSLTWWHKWLGIWIELLTEDRYKSYKDAKTILIDDHYIRSDINYEQ